MSGQYSVLWFSPRGFANEGTYYYGLTSRIEKFLETCDSDNVNIKWHWDKRNFRSLATAEKAARILCNRDHRDTPAHEICCIGYASVEEWLEQYERDERYEQRYAATH